MFNVRIDAARAGLALLAAVALTACGGGGGGSNGGGGGGTGVDPRVAEFAAMSDRLGNLFNTGFTGQPGEMPTSGTATFNGYAGVVLVTGGAPLSVIGDAAIDADFGARTLTGGFTNFVGDQDGKYGAYSGSVALVNGEIGFDTPRGTSVPNDVRFDYNGSLIGQGNTIILNGNASGKFKGTPIRGILAASPGGNTERLNGVDVPATFGVAVEGTPP